MVAARLFKFVGIFNYFDSMTEFYNSKDVNMERVVIKWQIVDY